MGYGEMKCSCNLDFDWSLRGVGVIYCLLIMLQFEWSLWMDDQIWKWRLQLFIWDWCSYQWYEQIDWRTAQICCWCHKIWKYFTVRQSQVRGFVSFLLFGIKCLFVYSQNLSSVCLLMKSVVLSSCSPNLVNHQVLIESMDCQRAHIGLYANRDVSTLSLSPRMTFHVLNSVNKFCNIVLNFILLISNPRGLRLA